jgi:ribose transport system substrate-binding protein
MSMRYLKARLTVRPLLVLSVTVVVAAAVLAGCGGGGSSSSTSAGSSASSGETSSFVGEADTQLAKLYKGTYELPEGPSPMPPAGTKNMWAISIGQAALSPVEGVNGFKEAAAELGWHVTVFDGKFEPNLWLAGIRNAVAANADGIWVMNIDCAPIKAAVEEAERAGIPVVINQGRECTPGQSAPAKYIASYDTHYDNGFVTKAPGSFTEWNQAFGAVGGWWIAAKTEAEAKLLLLVETDNGSTISIGEGVEAVMKKCSTCEIVEKVTFVGTDLGPNLQQKTQQALIQNPDTNAIHANYDTAVTSGVAGAVRSAGSNALLVGGEGFAPNIELLREGIQAAGTGYEAKWDGWCGADEFIYVFAGKEPRACGVGVEAYDAEHNLPPAGQGFSSGLPYQQAYLKSWGKG